MYLGKPDERTLEALRRLRGDQDFGEICAWIEYSITDLDRRNRVTMDDVPLRQQQGAAQALAEFMDRVAGKQHTAGAIARSIPQKG